MVGFMNDAALTQTRATGEVHFWSRTRQVLWRKGETSGHVLKVVDFYVNCERTSLLVTVHPQGPTCHDGYATCFYRRLEPDDELTIVAKRRFDPAVVYGPVAATAAEGQAQALAAATRLQFGAYAYLAAHDLADVSVTSARLRAAEDRISPRLADELGELAGALDGSHRHAGADRATGVRLEAGQVLYWALLFAVRAGASWERLRPDRALMTSEPALSPALVPTMLRAEAAHWRSAAADPAAAVARCHATIGLVAQTCAVAGVRPTEVLDADLAALRQRPYLAPYFEGGSSGAPFPELPRPAGPPGGASGTRGL
jgi:hypothetical protein